MLTTVRFLMTALVIAGLSQAATILPEAASQRDAPIVSWYLPARERGKLYDRHDVRASVFPPDPQHQTLVVVLWITPEIARAVVSYGIDHEQITADRADERVAQFRSPESHFALLRVYGVPAGATNAGAAVRSVVNEKKPGVDGRVLKPAFALPGTEEREPGNRAFLVSFPRVDSRGERTIQDLNDKVDIVMEYLGQSVHMRCRAKRFARVLEEL